MFAEKIHASEATDNRKSLYVAAIQLWVSSVQLAKAMEREDLAQLEGMQRHLALSKGLLPNIVRVCRRNPRADTRAAVLAIIHLLADNGEALCRLSVARFAQLLNRKEETIRAAIAGLEKGGEIGVCHSPYGNSYWPKIDAVVALMSPSPSMGWFADALSGKPLPRGRPKKSPGRAGGFSARTEPTQNIVPFPGREARK
jgi:hypothetical protein